MRDFQDYSLLKHNSFGVDARCHRFVEYSSTDELRALLPQLRGVRWMHIGAGCNLLFTGDYDGTILHSAIRGVEVLEDAPDGTVLVRAGAGEDWDGFVGYCVGAGLYGLENLSLIPGEVGASAVQNIGAYGSEVAQRIETVHTLCAATGEVRDFAREECRYGYRTSILKEELRGQYVVTHVTYRLSRHFVPDLGYAALAREVEARGLGAGLTAARLRELVIEVRRQKLPDPAETGSAGSFFMNPVVDEATYARLAAAYPGMPFYRVAGGVKIPAGWLIEQAGWKGRSLGRARVWHRQALVLVNTGGATGEEVRRLSEAVRDDVRGRFGIDLRCEVNIL
ncbi:MAG: UDP-N-acetylmuramate dehydrogenase [Alloprevotella sp.]|nr:UDP-N-acetylmuramate dehydrogenase [Alloprevotella sp.]